VIDNEGSQVNVNVARVGRGDPSTGPNRGLRGTLGEGGDDDPLVQWAVLEVLVARARAPLQQPLTGSSEFVESHRSSKSTHIQRLLLERGFMGYTPSLNSAERLRIVEALRRGNLSHRELAKQFNRAQSTISKIARDAGITSTHRRKRTPAASDVESTYDKQERVNFADRFIGVLDGMITDGGLSPKDAREVAQAAKVVLDARRSEDVEPEGAETHTSSARGGAPVLNLEEEFRRIDEQLEEENSRREGSHPDKEYGV
jgi:Trp operon repressor